MIENIKYKLSNGYFSEVGYVNPPFDSFEKDVYLSEYNLESLSTNKNKGTTLTLQFFTPGKNFKNGTFEIDGEWKKPHAYSGGTISINNVSQEFEVTSGTVTLSGDFPNIKIELNGLTADGKKIEARYSGNTKELFN